MPTYTRLLSKTYTVILKPGYRYLSNDAKLRYIKHAFPVADAIERINAAEQRRIFAPIHFDESTKNLTVCENPLQKVLVPIFGINTSISSTIYRGEYAVNTTTYSTDKDGKVTSHIRTDWYAISGQLNACSYGQEYSYGMTLYGGSTYHHRAIEDALECQPVEDQLEVFDAEKIEPGVFIDPFDKKDAYGREKANQRVHDAEVARARQDIRRRVYCDDARVYSISVSATTALTKNMLPVYIFKYKGLPPRVLAALSIENTQLHGPAPTSDIKVMMAATSAVGLLSLFMPPTVSIPARILLTMASAVLSGFWSHSKDDIRHSFQESDINRAKEDNDAVQATSMDEARLHATSRDVKHTQAKLEVDEEYYDILGLNPDEEITDESLKAAFTKKIQEAHKDKGGSDEAARRVIEARDLFNRARQKQDGSKRYFSTQRTLKFKEPPRSVYIEGTLVRIHGFFGYPPSDRTLLEKRAIELKSSQDGIKPPK